MMSKVLVDTSVILRFYARDDPLHTKALAALHWLEEQGYIPCIAPQVLYEMWVVLTRPVAQNGFGMRAEDAYQHLQQAVSDFQLLPDPPTLW
ncbi:MAG: PIN domain-containing protein [Armatimonadetes bacterium]|nr:PIN domain-containing protein [Armatimonadota bacterium]